MSRSKKDNKLYLSFALYKNRYALSEVTYFSQPFDTKTFNLVDDILLDRPQSVMSLATDFEDIDLDEYNSRGRKTVNMSKGNSQEPIGNVFDLKSL